MKKVMLLWLAIAVFGQMACNEDSVDGVEKKPEPNNSTGLLKDSDKAKLYKKTWYDQWEAINYQFRDSGELIMNQGLEGTWAWRGTSDTMDIAGNGNIWVQVWVSIKDSEATYRSDLDGDNFKTVQTLHTKP